MLLNFSVVFMIKALEKLLKMDIKIKIESLLIIRLVNQIRWRTISKCMRLPAMWHLTCVDSDEPLQPPFKLRHSKWCSVSSLTVIEYSGD